MPVQLDPAARDQLETLADEIANVMALQYGRARVSNPHYSAADLGHGGWSVLVVGMTDDVERQPVRVFVDGSTSETDAPAYREHLV